MRDAAYYSIRAFIIIAVLYFWEGFTYSIYSIYIRRVYLFSLFAYFFEFIFTANI